LRITNSETTTTFFTLVLQADESAITPPYLAGDRQTQGIQDLSAKYSPAQVRGMTSIKRHFHRLFPRAKGGQFYCNVILATTKAPAIIQDAMAIHLRDNRMGLWRPSIDEEQVSKIGWLLYSTCQQDEKQISRVLSTQTGEKIGARWWVIQTTTNARKQHPTAVKSTEVRAIHLKYDSAVLQHAKHKVANL